MSHLAEVAASHLQGSDEAVGFCSYCGRLEIERQRVCSACGLGVRLQTSAGVLGSAGATFLVVRSDGRVSAASAAADRMLAMDGNLVGQPLAGLITSREDDGALARAVKLAAAGDPRVADVGVALVGARRRCAEVRARVTACGLPPAALVLLEGA